MAHVLSDYRKKGLGILGERRERGGGFLGRVRVSPRTIHFWVLDKSPLSGAGRGPPSCNSVGNGKEPKPESWEGAPLKGRHRIRHKRWLPWLEGAPTCVITGYRLRTNSGLGQGCQQKIRCPGGDSSGFFCLFFLFTPCSFWSTSGIKKNQAWSTSFASDTRVVPRIKGIDCCYLRILAPCPASCGTRIFHVLCVQRWE